MKFKVLWLHGLMLAATAGPVQAGMITVANHSFENPSNLIGLPASWQSFGGASSYNPYLFGGGNAFYLGANPGTVGTYPGIDGSRVGYAYQSASGSGLEQTLSTAFAANTAYTLRVAVGHRNGTPFGAATLGSKIELFAGTTVIASSTDNSGPAAGLFADQTAFLAASNSYSGLAGQLLKIRITTTLPSTITNQATDWDNVRLDGTAAAVVPEPSSIVMFGVGALGLVFARRNRHQKKLTA